MSQSSLLDIDYSFLKDISKEPRVKPQDAPRKKTHTITAVPPQYVKTLWPDVKDNLARAIDRSNGRWDLGTLYHSLVNEHQHLWIAFNEDKVTDGVGTTEFVQYPMEKYLCVQFLGGNRFNDWVWDMVETFNSWAKDNGCVGIEATARHGFWKWLQQDGFKQSYTVYEKRID